MTTDAITADLHEPQPLFCYRHPDRETWVRCGRCDQPICTRCAMQGPVGLRCRTCGKPSRDALTSLKPNQIAIALAVATGLGAVVGYFGAQFGFLMIVIGFLLDVDRRGAGSDGRNQRGRTLLRSPLLGCVRWPYRRRVLAHRHVA